MTVQDPLFWLGLGVSILCGAFIGIERQFRRKPAGIRTSILFCMGTQVFVRLGVLLAGDQGDPSRVLGQVITGIGFLGAGVILTRQGTVTGLTSASVVWVTAAIGAVAGLNLYAEALALTLATVVLLVSVQKVEEVFGFREEHRGDSSRGLPTDSG
jgi:putative Mg2+ transporter-C (MgtC) family protein